jgi:thiol-disulfide isomerase/thioredoxin
MAEHEPSPREKAQRQRMLLTAIALAIGLVAMLLFAPRPTLGQTSKLNKGHMAAFVYKPEPAPIPEFKFVDGENKPLAFKDFTGKVVLLNLWATWCAPCRKEMPDLDRLQAELGSDKFEVVAISVDRSGVNGARKFLDQIGTKRLALYADPSARLASELKVIGLPATLLIDAEGREVGRLLGPAEWASDDAKALVKSVIR